ncbi:MAG: HAD-IA family hydrolase [Anaerolineaceae bacterium]|nr:HAD-IA family hydrolase [Anaerolineaceae bacterium]
MTTQHLPTSSPAEQLALVFDWGNTLMKSIPEQSGPMAFWQEISEVDGSIEALDKLIGKLHMVVGTNAGDSNAELVWKALRRVGMGEYFSAVYTAKDLGAAKPDPLFFRQIESMMDRPTYQMVMIGDQYTVDILGAKSAGWKAIWYNPEELDAPGATPLQDAEIADLRDLPATIQRLTLPDYATCLFWLEESSMPYNLLAHVHLVAATAYLLAVWLKRKRVNVNPVLAHRGGLLHDLAKMKSLHQKDNLGDDHAAMAREQLAQRGQPELAEIANRHMPYQKETDPRRPETWEQKLVHFADKLCEGAHLVTPAERITALKGRYPHYAAELEASFPLLLALQEEICTGLRISADEMIRQLRATLRT